MAELKTLHSITSRTKSPQILVTRTDRLGDVMLSLPVLNAIKKAAPDAKISFLVKAPLKTLLSSHPLISNLLIYAPESRHKGFVGFFRLMEDLKPFQFNTAVMLHSELKIAAAVFGVGIKNRVGPLSKWFSYLFYNLGTRQKRSRVEMHESQYNLQLLRKIGIRPFAQKEFATLPIEEHALSWAKQWLSSQNLDFNDRLILVHPGMGGSALNWPKEHYLELIASLLNEGNSVIVAGSKLDEKILNDLKSLLHHSQAYPVFLYTHLENADLSKYAALLSLMKLVIAPSTGPLHLAMALNVPTLSFYPPIRVQSAVRWGPYGESDSRVLNPEVYCGQVFKCLGSSCHSYPCMNTIHPKVALNEVNHLLSKVHQKKVQKENHA